MTMKRELIKCNGARNVINRNSKNQHAFSLIGGLRRLLAFAVLSIASTSGAWAACTGGMTISAAPLSHTYSTISDRTIVISGTVSKSGSFCGFAGIPAGTVRARVGSTTANIPYDKFSRKFSGNLVLPAGFTAGSYTLQMDFISANTSILSSRQTFSYTLKSARQTIDGLPFGTITYGPGKTIALNVSASSGLPVTLSASPSYICALQAGKIVIYGAGNCSIVGTQPGNTNYFPGYGSSTITLLRAQQTVSLPTVPTQTLVLDKIIPLTITSSSGTPIFLRNLTPNICIAAGRDARLRGAGLCRFEVSAYGTVNYLPSAPVVLQFTIDPGPQKPLTLTSTRPNLSYGGQSALLAVGGSGSGVVSYKVTAGGGVCSLAGGTLTATGVGTCTVMATKAADANYTAASSTLDITVAAAAQAPLNLVASPAVIAFGGTTTLSATGGSGTGAVSYVISAGSSFCSLSGNTLNATGVGTCTLSATKAADANYLAASTTLDVAVAKASQFISFPVPASRPFVAGGTIALNPSASSGLPVAIITATPRFCAVSGNTAIMTNAGRCNLFASSPGNQNYSATNVLVAFNITKASQARLTVAASPATIAIGDSTTLAVTGGSGAGAVTYSVTAGGTFCSLSGTTVTANGSGTCTLTATKAADINHIAAVSATVDITAVKATQTISFTPPKNRVYVAGEAIALSAAASSGLPVTFATTSPGICAINRNSLAVLSAGTCALTAQQAGNVVHNPVSSAAQFTIFKAAQTITFTNPGAQVFSPGKIITFSATNSSGLPFYFRSLTTKTCTTVGASGKTAVLNAPGVCSIVVINGGDKNYLLTSTRVSFDINKAAQAALAVTAAPSVIAFGGTSALAVTGGSGTGALSYAISAGNTFCSLSRGGVTGTGVGTCTVTASKAADANFTATTASVAITVGPATQTAINVTAAPAAISFNGSTTLSYSGGSGTGAVSYKVTAGAAFCSLSATTLTGTGVGTCTLTASKAADANFTATTASVAITVGPATQTAINVTAAPATISFNGSTTLSYSGGSGTGAVSYKVTAGAAFCSLSGTTLTGTGVGTCTVTASKGADAAYTTTTASVDIAVGPATQAAINVTAAPAAIAFGGATTLSLSGGSGTGAVSYKVTAGAAFCSLSGTTLTGTGVGTCTVTASKGADAAYAAATATVDVTVSQSSQAPLALRATPAAITALTGPATLQVSGGSGSGAVSYAVSPGGAACSIKGNQLACAGVGTARITATKTADANFSAASTSITVPYDTIAIATGIAASAGTPQSAVIKNAFTNRLTVKITDALGRPLSGTAVTFAAPLRGPSALLSATTAASDANGLASITASANDLPGTYTITATIASGASTTFSLSNNRDRAADIRQTQSKVRSFIGRRARQILATEPALTARLGGGRQSAGGVIGLTGNGDENNAQVAFSFSLRGALDAASTKTKSAQLLPGRPAMLGFAKSTTSGQAKDDTSGFDLWVEGKWIHANSGDTDATGSVIYGGVDYRFNQDFLMGVVVQLDWTDEKTSAQNTSATGKGWLVGPYLVSRLHENLVLDGRIAWGQSANSINALGLSKDKFDSTRWLAHGRLTGDFKNGAWRFNPNADLTYFEEQQQAYVDSLGNLIPSQTVALGRLTFGPKVSYRSEWADGSSLTPFFGVQGIWDFKATDTASAQGAAPGTGNELRARLEGGLSARTSLGIKLDANGFYDGIAAKDFEAYGGSLRVTIPIDH